MKCDCKVLVGDHDFWCNRHPMNKLLQYVHKGFLEESVEDDENYMEDVRESIEFSSIAEKAVDDAWEKAK